LNITRLEKIHTEELSQAKQQFFTNISHELRTPVSLIMPPIHQILINGNLDEESRSLISLAEKNSHRLLRVINQILDFRKLENDSLQIKVAKVELVNFCRDIHSLFSDKANRKKISFNFDSKVFELGIWIDSEKIETVLFNLLSNAFKFTKTGGTIKVSLHQDKKTNDYPEGVAAIQVSDTGIGLTTDEKSKIFEPFYQTREAKQMEMGTGIGLALAAEYVKLHHGQILVDSIKGEGTTFTINLPLGKSHFPVDYIHEEEELELIAVKEIASDNQTLKPYRFDLHSNKPLILIIDDSNDMIDMVRISLGEKYNFISAENGEEGLQKAYSFLPELIISDIMMPVMDGLTLCKRIKENSKTSHISIILVTAKGLTSQKIEGIKMGADVYITKPFEMEFLEANMDHLMERKRELMEYLKNVLNTQPVAESNKENLDEKFIKKVMNVIEANISNPDFGVEQLSGEVGMSASYLYRKLKSLTRLSTNEIIKKYRIKKASILLKNKGGNVTEIMYDVGFSNLSYFSKCFKAEFGLNPKDYQQKMSMGPIEFDLEIKS
jgi:CheY-like chemotaxis protein